MLKPSEIRIGNWIADRGLKEWQIDHWETMNKVSAKPNTMMCGGILMETHPLTEYVDYLKPIIISENWLLKFGFEKEKNKIDVYRNCRIRVWIGSRGASLSYLIEEDTTIGHYINTIEHVHQLQNLYFAFVGEELVLQD